MYFMKYENWGMFLTISILVIIILNYYSGTEKFKMGSNHSTAESSKESEASETRRESTDRSEESRESEREYTSKNSLEGDDLNHETPLIEHFSVVPTYVGTDFQQTIVAPTFAEEWQIPPPAYDLYTQVPYPGASQDTFETPLQPKSYPYAQYLTRTNLLPSDEYFTHLGCGGARTAREYINSTFLRHDLAYRENMTRLYKKRLNRRFRHNNSGDTVSPFSSY
jgi:hypothetical protein